MAQPMANASPKGDGAMLTPILPQLQSPLLRLPGEIRNKIYEYALEDSEPLQIIGSLDETPYETHATRLHQFNELKHSCRQLRTETGYMGSVRNDTFSSPAVKIIRHSSTRRVMCYDYARRLDHHFLWRTPIYSHAAVCEKDPQLNLAIFTRALRRDLGCRDLLVVGAALQVVVRGEHLPFRLMEGLRGKIKNMATNLKMFNTQFRLAESKLLPSNIRIYPMEEYDEAEIRCSYRGKVGLEDCVAQIRRWYKNGI